MTGVQSTERALTMKESNGAARCGESRKLKPLYDCGADFERRVKEREFGERLDIAHGGGGVKSNFFEGFVVALGPAFATAGADFPGAVEYMNYAGGGGRTADLRDALAFDTWADAMRWALDNCEIPEMPMPIPRGFEKPKYPKVCHVRLWADVSEC